MMEEEYGRARVRDQGLDGVEKLQEAIDTCPVSCIHWVGATAGWLGGCVQQGARCWEATGSVPMQHARAERMPLVPRASTRRALCPRMHAQVTAPQLTLLEATMGRMERVAAWLLVSGSCGRPGRWHVQRRGAGCGVYVRVAGVYSCVSPCRWPSPATTRAVTNRR